ncbi:MAG: hypothetical protein ABI397_01360 [Candidatus Saccharimonas sp.]
MQNPLPKLVTFDGEARSGKGTVVGLVKDHLRDNCGYKVMLIDLGQIFRVLVVKLMRDGVDLDIPEQIDAYLSDETNANNCVSYVKKVYHMPKEERKALLYEQEVGVCSAKVGARPLSQSFKDSLLCKWIQDARSEGFEVVLLDGRALEEVGSMLVSEGLCDYRLGFYFICNPIVSAQRILGFMPKPYGELDDETRQSVDEVVGQIEQRNKSDRERLVQPIVPPSNAPHYAITEVPDELPPRNPRPMAIIDRSIELPLDVMVAPIARLVELYAD